MPYALCQIPRVLLSKKPTHSHGNSSLAASSIDLLGPALDVEADAETGKEVERWPGSAGSATSRQHGFQFACDVAKLCIVAQTYVR